MAVKYRLFRLLSGGEGDPVKIISLYRDHIYHRVNRRWAQGDPMDRWKMNLDDYQNAAIRLFESMKMHGFSDNFPIPIDPMGELLGGAHRVACALALGVEMVPVIHRGHDAWAPPWGVEWFVEHGFDAEVIRSLEMTMEEIKKIPPA